MGFYDRHILPKLLNMAMKAPAMNKIRRQLVPLAEGKVLEIGIGSGLNLPYYQDGTQVTGLDPSLELQSYAREIAAEQGRSVEFLPVSGEEIPADDNSFDSVVMTWTLCTIPRPARALSEIRRVLKPGARVVFAEHGMSPDDNVFRWQQRINPIWRAIAGGCNLHRDIEGLYQNAGFNLDDVERGYIEGPKFATYNTRGLARLS